ncbi:MAG: flagellar hook protein FlgE [Thermodesulfobacteriota bacterium]|nr:flagellar hook protein FlgE [Thermodesulfobacteriota bacterium]
MSLSSSLFTGVSGLSNIGNSMNIIGDNISNVNTVGFKASRATFQDALSQSIAVASGSSQIGRGMSLANISQNFAPGSFESSDSSTDLSIAGDGFFVLKDSLNSESVYYTRAGEFNVDKDGNLVNPGGHIVQGWAVSQDATTGKTEDVGVITNVQFSSLMSEPSATSKMRAITNLNSDAESKSAVLEQSWNAQNSTPIEGKDYEYQTTLKAYDSLGDSHDIQIYYDPSATASIWEFIVTCNPEEDNRAGAQAALTGGDDGVGMIARGEIVFDPSEGFITDINLDEFTYGADYTIAGANWTTRNEATDLTDGYFTISPDFIDGSSPLAIQLDFGSQCTDTAAVPPTWTNDSLSTTQYAVLSSTNFQSSNGYGVGDLQSIAVEKDGIINGQYSNGQSSSLFRMALAKFHSTQGLGKIGGNLYEETAQSGSVIINRPGTNGLGTILANSLEQSNVDIANEFVKMITTQRGYQANSRIITVTDQMLADVIAMKR